MFHLHSASDGSVAGCRVEPRRPQAAAAAAAAVASGTPPPSCQDREIPHRDVTAAGVPTVGVPAAGEPRHDVIAASP